MNYWLDLFTPYTWTRFKEHGSTISGFRPRQRKHRLPACCRWRFVALLF